MRLGGPRFWHVHAVHRKDPQHQSVGVQSLWAVSDELVSHRLQIQFVLMLSRQVSSLRPSSLLAHVECALHIATIAACRGAIATMTDSRKNMIIGTVHRRSAIGQDFQRVTIGCIISDIHGDIVVVASLIDYRIATFATIFPAYDPKYVLIVTLDEPSIVAYGEKRRTAGWTAVPVAAELIGRVAPLLGLRPRLEPEARAVITLTSN